MDRKTLIWTIVFLLAGAYLVLRSMTGGMARTYMKAVDFEFVNVAADGDEPEWIQAKPQVAADHDPNELANYPDENRETWTRYESAPLKKYAKAVKEDPNQTTYLLSISRTIGVWLSALFTLAIFSFLYKDSIFYKIAEAVVVGVSAAYWMVVAFWSTIVPNLIGKLSPAIVQAWAMPGLKEEQNLLYIVPLVLGAMLLWQLAPKGGWISRWPLAFFIGVFCGIRLTGYMHGDFLYQIGNSIIPLVVMVNGSFDFWGSLRAVLLVGGLLVCLVYFFFSFEHKGIVGKTAKVGIWVLMITFGAGFGYTVMGRIALLAIRLEFLFDDWLWLMDPTDKRLGM